MTRRELLKLGLAAPLAVRELRADAAWRTWRVVTRVELHGPTGAARAWIPVPSTRGPYQRDVKLSWSGSGAMRFDPNGDAPAVVAEWNDVPAPRIVEVTAIVATRDHAVDLTRPLSQSSARVAARYLQPTTLIATDGIVRETAAAIVAGKSTQLAKARAIYDWIVDNTVRDPTVRGCGLGDIRWMLESKTYAGKCADLNALFVGLARAAGLPARDWYGLRVAPSATFASLGRAGNVTTAQHCRAEVHVSGLGWVPVDPADVAKIRLEERGNGPLTDPLLQTARDRMFGRWEMNWIAFNDAHDVRLPGAAGRPLPFFMYPVAEINGERIDSLDAAAFRYEITASA